MSPSVFEFPIFHLYTAGSLQMQYSTLHTYEDSEKNRGETPGRGGGQGGHKKLGFVKVVGPQMDH